MKKAVFFKPLKTGMQILMLLAISCFNVGSVNVAYAGASMHNPNQIGLQPDDINGATAIYGPATLSAPPVNDDFANASTKTIGSIPYSDILDTTGANPVGDGPAVPGLCEGRSLRKGTKNVWYTYTPPANQVVSFDTLGSTPPPGIGDYDTYIAIWTGPDIDHLTLIGCDDDTDSYFQSQLVLSVSSGIQYYIEVAQYNGTLNPPSNPETATGGSLHFHVNFTNINITIGGQLIERYYVPAGGSVRRKYVNINSGPAKIANTNSVPIVASQRVLYGNSYSEMMGLPLEQLSHEYWFPYYNNVAMDSQLRVSNLGGGTTAIKVYLGTQQIDSYSLAAGAARRWNYDGKNGGPLRVTSSATNILSTIRVLYGGNSYSELMGLPLEQLTDEYLFPYYNNVAMDSQLRVSNVGGAPTTIKVYLGTQQIDSYSLAAGAARRWNYDGKNGGPLRVTSSASNILTTIRVLYGGSLSELMGFPANQLDQQYWYPVYDNSSLDSQLRVSNVGAGTTTITVYAAGDLIDSYDLAAGAATRRNYLQNIGPLHVLSSTEPILTTIRMLYNTPTFSSLYEMTGLPDSQLSAQYFFPWYNNVAMDSQLRFAMP